MPYLEINGNVHDSIFTYAAMMHPDNERHREELIATHITSAILEGNTNDHDVEIPAYILRVLLTSPSYEEVKNRALSSSHGGSTAGDVLLYLAEMQLTGHQEPSLNKAFYAAERYLTNALNADGKKGASSERSIRKNWEKFKPVAHLWAAFRMLQFKNKNPHSFDFGLMLLDGLGEFLAIAEYFRSFGEGFASFRNKSKESIFLHDETWRVPENYSLPSMYVCINEMHEDLKEFLQDYRAPINTNP